MIRFTLAVILAFATSASAQTPTPEPCPADITKTLTDGAFLGKAQVGSEPDMDKLCFARVDVDPVVQYGCVSVAPGAIGEMTINVAETPGKNAEIKGFVQDTGGLLSELSCNTFTVDFTVPLPPVLVP